MVKLALFIDGKLTGWSQTGQRNSCDFSQLGRGSWGGHYGETGPVPNKYEREMAFYEPGMIQNPSEIDFPDEGRIFPDRLL